MITLNFLKKISFFSVLLLVTQIYGQETIIPLTQGGWVGGLSGNVSWNNYDTFASSNESNSSYNSKSDGFGFSLSSRNGRFVINNLSVGFDLEWSENELTTNLNSGEEYKKNRLGFFGLWSRYYIPFIGTGWAVFPEASIGYGNYKLITDEIGGPDVILRDEISADGLAYNLGFGATMFVSNNVAFETTLRYQGGTLKGDFEKRGTLFDNYEIELSNIDILFGIMIYLK